MIKENQSEDSPDRLASELGAIRSRMDEKIKTLQDELSPAHLIDLAVDRLTPGSKKSTTDTLRASALRAGCVIRQYPLTTALLCGGLLAWLIEGGRSRSSTDKAAAARIDVAPTRPSPLYKYPLK